MQAVQQGTITAYLTPLVAGQLDRLPPGSHCIANAYTSHHDELESEDLGTLKRFTLHAIDAVGLVHAAILGSRRCFCRFVLLSWGEGISSRIRTRAQRVRRNDAAGRALGEKLVHGERGSAQKA